MPWIMFHDQRDLCLAFHIYENSLKIWPVVQDSMISYMRPAKEALR